MFDISGFYIKLFYCCFKTIWSCSLCSGGSIQNPSHGDISIFCCCYAQEFQILHNFFMLHLNILFPLCLNCSYFVLYLCYFKLRINCLQAESLQSRVAYISNCVTQRHSIRNKLNTNAFESL